MNPQVRFWGDVARILAWLHDPSCDPCKRYNSPCGHTLPCRLPPSPLPYWFAVPFGFAVVIGMHLGASLAEIAFVGGPFAVCVAAYLDDRAWG